MNYFIQRDEQQYGPYTLADLQRYTASGHIGLDELCISEGQPEPVPVAQIVGTIAVPQSYIAPVSPISFAPDPYPTAPNLPWGLVLLFVVITCGYFYPVWELVLCLWLKKVEPQNKALFVAIAALTFATIYFVGAFVGVSGVSSGLFTFSKIAYFVCLIINRFNFKSGFEQHYNSVEPMGIELNGVMTFFFGGIYFQYHVNDIVRRKLADRLYELGR